MWKQPIAGEVYALVTKIQMLAITSGIVKYNPASMVVHDGSKTEFKTPTFLPWTPLAKCLLVIISPLISDNLVTTPDRRQSKTFLTIDERR